VPDLLFKIKRFVFAPSSGREILAPLVVALPAFVELRQLARDWKLIRMNKIADRELTFSDQPSLYSDSNRLGPPRCAKLNQ
jgi:hypothetical protein